MRLTKKRPVILYGTYVYDERVHRGILQFGRQKGWKVRLLQPHSWQHATMLEADGIISMMEPEEDPGKMTDYLRSLKLPKVDLSRNWPEEPALRLLPDAREAGRLAGQYFNELGFRSWVKVCYGQTWHDDLRIEGFMAVAKESGAECILLEMRNFPGNRVEDLRRALSKMQRPIAVFCSFDHYAEQVLEICLESGWAVPEEVTILGCYNHEVHSVFAEIPLSTIDMGLEARGYQAASLLQGLMAGNPMPPEPLYSPIKGIIERASSNPASSRDSVVAQAIHFIQSQMHRALEVEEVASAVGVSRPALQRRFENALGHGVAKHINTLKMESAERMFRETEDSAAMIGAGLGYPDPLHFYRVFKRHSGLTTKEYRARFEAERGKSS